MLVIQQLRRLAGLPALMLLGLALMALGGALDVAVHFGPLAPHAHAHAAHEAHGVLGSEHAAHLLGIAGMALVLVGVVLHGARRHRRVHAATHGGSHGNAHR